MSVSLSFAPIQQYFDNNSVELTGGKLFTYLAGSLTKAVTYTDSTGGTPNTNPIILDSRGECEVWIVPGVAYKFVLAPSTDTDPPTNPFWTVDDITSGSTGVAGTAAYQTIALAEAANIPAGTAGVQTFGYYAVGDGGGALYVPSSSPAGAGKFQSADGQWWIISNEQVTFEMFGAKGDFNGSTGTDNTVAISNALAFSKDVKVLSKNYLCTSAVALAANGGSMTGCGNASVITTNSATADLLDITGDYYTISKLRMTSSVTKTSGYFINLDSSTNYVNIDDVTLDNWWGGISTECSVLRITDSRIMDGISGANAAVIITGGVDIVLQNLWITSASISAQITSGVVIQSSGDVTLDHVSCAQAGNGLLIAPNLGQRVQVVFATNCYFDTGAGGGIVVEAADYVELLKFTQCWSASNASGGLILNITGAGHVLQSDFENCVFSNNTGRGAILNSAAVINTTFTVCSFSANSTDGVYVAVGVPQFKFIGCTFGASGEFAGNGTYGLTLAGSNDDFIISDNVFSTNTIGGLSLATPAGAPGVSNRISGNIGFETLNTGSVALTAAGTTTVVSHGLGYTPSVANGGSVVPVLETGFGTAAYMYIDNITSTQFTINTNANPGAGVSVAWTARTLGE